MAGVTGLLSRQPILNFYQRMVGGFARLSLFKKIAVIFFNPVKLNEDMPLTAKPVDPLFLNENPLLWLP